MDGFEFRNAKTVSDNVMKERSEANIGTIKHQAQVISYNLEDKMWNEGILGEDSPDKLHDTVLFLVGINCGLRAGDEHYDLRRDSKEKSSQFSFKCNEAGVRCLVYTEDTVIKTNDGGLASMKKERKIVWISPSNNMNRCPVRLVDKYLSLCPEVDPKLKPNFYLRSLDKINPAQWYGSQVVGRNTLRKTVGMS